MTPDSKFAISPSANCCRAAAAVRHLRSATCPAWPFVAEPNRGHLRLPRNARGADVGWVGAGEACPLGPRKSQRGSRSQELLYFYYDALGLVDPSEMPSVGNPYDLDVGVV